MDPMRDRFFSCFSNHNLIYQSKFISFLLFGIQNFYLIKSKLEDKLVFAWGKIILLFIKSEYFNRNFEKETTAFHSKYLIFNYN